MSKERARRRAEREREAAIQAAARAAEAERQERRAARRRALTRWLPEQRRRPAGRLAERQRTQTRLLFVGALIVNAIVWLGSGDWAVRAFALLITLLVVPIVQILMTKN